MSVKIRLTRQGGKKKPFYRVVVASSEAPRDGSFLEVVGTYDPMASPALCKFNEERIAFWISRGAIPTETVKQYLKKSGLPTQKPKAA